MNWKSLGLVLVFVIVGSILYLKQRTPSTDVKTVVGQPSPQVLIVADFSEADTPGDGCAEIIRLVRAAKRRGIRTDEFEPGSKPELLTRYRVLTAPTVVILGPDGQPQGRFEGESTETIASLRKALEGLRAE